MPVSLARKGVWAVIAVVVLAVMGVLVLPLVASTQIVRDSIAHQMSAWSGYRVRLDDRPEIHVWPAFRAVLHDVTLQDWNTPDARTVLSAERVELDLSALSALRGGIVFTKMRLTRPVLRLARQEGALRVPPPESWGKLARSIQAARETVEAAPEQPDKRILPNDAFGVIEFVEGRIVASSPEDQTELATSLTGTLDWPALNNQASLSANGIWRGESVAVTASSTDPLILLGGGSAPLSLSLKAAPAEASFKGPASLARQMFADGQVNLTAPSLNRLIEWTQGSALPGARIGPFSLSAHAVGDRRRVKFEGTALSFDKSTGKGLLDVTLDAARPLIAGTLAFDTLNLDALVNTFSPFSSGTPPLGNGTAAMKGTGPDFDMRFSAASATYGTAPLTNVAASVKVKGALTAFDISDATAFGGTVQFGMRTDRSGKDNLVEIVLAGEEIEADKLATVFGLGKLMPQARSGFSVILKGTGRDLDSVLETAEGSVSATFGKGSMPGLSLDAFLKRSDAGDFFPLSAIEGGTLPIEDADLKASISKGVVRIDKAEARSGQYLIAFDGLMPFAGRGLALYGTLSAPEGGNQRLARPLMFFVGGSWNAPFIASFKQQQ